MNLKELFTNADGQLSTTNTIQMMSAITLCAGFIYSVVVNNAIAGELALVIAGMATLTATSKGFVGMKKGKDQH